MGGGLPIGLIAGRAKFLDRIDGGPWSYGDSSTPAVETTFAAGTFCKHPLAMAAARAVLERFQAEGPSLQLSLAERTRHLAETCNRLFQEEEAPIRVIFFSSMFRFVSSSNTSYLYQPLEMDLFFFHLISKGVYIWEARTCFLSTAHTESHIDHIIEAVRSTVREMKSGGYFGDGRVGDWERTPSTLIEPEPLEQPISYDCEFPLSYEQERILSVAQQSEEASIAYNETLAFDLTGALDCVALERSIKTVVRRHESLRTVLAPARAAQSVRSIVPVSLPILDMAGTSGLGTVECPASNKALREFLQMEASTPFDITHGPLFRFYIVKLSDTRHVFLFSIHHLVTDGSSLRRLLEEIETIYRTEVEGGSSFLESPVQYRKYVQWERRSHRPGNSGKHIPSHLFKRGPECELDYAGARLSLRFEQDLYNDVRRLARDNGFTLFTVLLAAFIAVIHRWLGRDSLGIGIPIICPDFADGERPLGPCSYLTPIRFVPEESQTFSDYVECVQNSLLPVLGASSARPVVPDSGSGDLHFAPEDPAPNFTFNFDRSLSFSPAGGTEAALIMPPIRFSRSHLGINILATEGFLLLDCDYRTSLLDEILVKSLLKQYMNVLKEAVYTQDREIEKASG